MPFQPGGGSGGGGAVSSVFGRAGAVVKVTGDYGFADISGLVKQEMLTAQLPRLHNRVSNYRGEGQEVSGQYVNVNANDNYAQVALADVVTNNAFTSGNASTAAIRAVYKIHPLIGFSTGGGTDPANDAKSRSANDMLDLTLATNVGVGFLHRAGVLSASGDGRNAPDPADRIYQQASIAHLVDCMKTLGCEAFFMDTCGDTATSDLLGYLPDEYDNYFDYMTRGQLGYMRAVYPAVRGMGGKIYANAGGGNVGPFSYESATRFDSTLRWLTMVAPQVDGFFNEYFCQSAQTVTYRVSDVNFEVGSGGPDDWWRGMIRMIRHCQVKLGKAFWGWTYGTNSAVHPSNDTVLRYAMGCYLLAFDGEHEGGVIYGFPNPASDTSPTYRWAASNVYPAPGIAGNPQRTAAFSWMRSLVVDGVTKTLLVNTDPSNPHTIAGTSIPATDARIV